MSAPSSSPTPTPATTSALHRLKDWATITVLDKYLTSQIVDSLLIALSVFTLLVFFSDTFLDFIRDIQKYGIPINTALLLIGLQLPKTMTLIVPASAFLAVLLVYSNLNGKHEIMAMRMCGIPLMRLVRPAIVVGLLATMFTYVMGDYVVPVCNSMVDTIKNDLLTHGTLPVGRQSVTFRDSDDDGHLRKLVYVSGYDGDNLGPSTIVDVSDPDVMQVVQSQGGKWFPTHWEFHKANVYSLFKKSETFTFNNSGVMRVKDLLNSAGLKTTQKATKKASLKDKLALDSSELSFGQLLWRINKRESLGMIVNKGTYIRLWEKLTLPLSCLAMILVAVPLAITAPRQSANRGIIFAIAALFLFYMLRAFGAAIGKNLVAAFDGILPMAPVLGVSSWLPVLTIAAIGAALLWRKRMVL